jgi:hypothetical protein
MDFGDDDGDSFWDFVDAMKDKEEKEKSKSQGKSNKREFDIEKISNILK